MSCVVYYYVPDRVDTIDSDFKTDNHLQQLQKLKIIVVLYNQDSKKIETQNTITDSRHT